jgi:hypothetical protein
VVGSFNGEAIDISGFATSTAAVHIVELRGLAIHAPGTYHIPPTFGAVSYQVGLVTYSASDEPGGTVKIDVLDTEARVFTGRFDFIMVNLAQPGVTVHLEGRFRYHYPLTL